MKEIGLYGGQKTIVDDEDYGELSRYQWHLTKNGYAIRNVRKSGGIGVTILMHRQILKAPRGSQVDHRNLNKLDNRRENLRICSAGQNKMNRVKYQRKRKPSSRYKGVHFAQNIGKWRAQIQKRHLGNFRDEEQAAIAYDRAAIRTFGPFARTNFPQPVTG